MATERATLLEFARRYTAAWCSQNAASVAAFYAPNGSLRINGGVPTVGHTAVTEAVQGFMSAFPDLRIRMDNVHPRGEGAVYHWTLIGTNTGPGGTGQPVRISGFEVWKLSPEVLIAESEGYFDNADYQRQLVGP